jgi:hypothetical protein
VATLVETNIHAEAFYSIPCQYPSPLSAVETDVVKLRDAKVLHENSGKTADEVCKVVWVGRQIFFAYLAQQRDQQSTTTAN